MLTLKGRRIEKAVEPDLGLTVLDEALKHKVDWGFSCTRGTCSRCRCSIVTGVELMNTPTKAELDNLEPEEIGEGYRLGCQAKMVQAGDVTVVYKPYF